jgi:hypothetical protein
MPTGLSAESTPETHMQAAMEFLRMFGLDAALEIQIDNTVDLVVSVQPRLAPIRNVLRDFISRMLSFEAFGPQMAGLFVEAFSELELRQMAWFYGSAAGQHAIRETPALMLRGTEMGREIAAEHMGELEDVVRRYLADHPEIRLDQP